MVYLIESILEVIEDCHCEKSVIHISTDFIHKKGYGCFSGEILPGGRLTGRHKIVSI